MDGEIEVDNAYETAVMFLLQGAMPVIVEAQDGMHVLSVQATNRDMVEAMFNPNYDERMRFIVSVTKCVKETVEEVTAQ
jgi:hypothetical protein